MTLPAPRIRLRVLPKLPPTPGSLAIGTVTAGSSPSATIDGNSQPQTLNLVLPFGPIHTVNGKGDTDVTLTAADIGSDPASAVFSTNVQDVIAELDLKKAPIANSLTSAATLNLQNVDAIRVNRWSNSAAFAPANYNKVDDEPTHDAKFQSTDGSWFTLAEGDADPMMFGADGGGSINDSPALARLKAYCEATGARYKFGRFGPTSHKLSETFEITTSADLRGSTFFVPGATVTPGIRLGVTTSGQETISGVFYGPDLMVNTDKPSTGWVGVTGAIGIQLATIDDWKIELGHTKNFGINLDVTAFGALTAYNNIDPGWLDNGMKNCRIKQGDASCAVNENKFWGGRFSHAGGEGTNVSGVRHISMEESDTPNANGVPNQNNFFSPSVEGDTPEHHWWCQGTDNHILFPRGEVSAEAFKVNFHSRTTEQSVHNTIVGGYGTDGFVFTHTGQPTRYNGLISVLGSVYEASSSQTVDRPTATWGNGNGDTIATPHHQGFGANTSDIIETTYADTTWVYRMFGQGFAGKQGTDTTQRVELNWSGLGFLRLGDGTSGGRSTIAFSAAGLTVDDVFRPSSDNARTLGNATDRWKQVFGAQFMPGAGTAIWTCGALTPNGALSAPVGSLYSDSSGGLGNTLYSKEAGSSTSGWAHVVTSSQATVATDADFTLTVGTNARNIRHTGTLTAARAVTLATTGAIAGDVWHITRSGTGAFNLNVGTGPLKAMATATWAEFTFDGTAWYESAAGSL